MCGIIGIVSGNAADHDKFAACFEVIKTRGTSTSAQHKGAASLGLSRLPTDDVANTALDVIEEKDGVTVLFNGLITNTKELQEEYELSRAAAQSDTLCLREGLQTFGMSFL